MASQDDNSNKGEKILVSIDADLEELIPEYIGNRLKDIKSISESLGNGDYENIRTTGHSMKGSGGGFGFDRISEIGAAIEVAAMEEDHETIKNCNDELSTYLDNIVISYE